METVLIVIHLMVVLALVGVVLLQRSEGGGLGIGGGSGFMTARGAANALTRATAILAAAFFATSLTLSLVARYGEKPIDILDRVPASSSNAGKGVLDQLPGNAPAAPSTSTAPAAPASGSATPPSSGNGAATTAPAPAPAPANPATPPAANGVTLPVTPQVPNQ
ncbi:preprotein translocase subunit SecG [Mesorhizobium sp. M4B.F.Ca.ET.017.02.2.1]|uniref:preprotein translocase subunit SecG n=1 Tax=Mesorhizobium sp. M4B.F.Ca.ET.017.02.2.1 TaxID=2496649 RepID=UPI000FCB8CDC|nr:preprotein translocase subunit SecG [Mesorhizobium sp. M4B.F.Ca.ET.017.02.2.1]RVD24944.1 preprotein translocase subunit SecG [Mesorhizobium sp. M4B.F.Ca.ET.017.02.2.1]